MSKKAVILLSGGMDSAVVLAIAQHENYECYALSFDYGQRAKTELHAAARLARNFKVKQHKIISLDLGTLHTTALTNPQLELNESLTEEITSSYVPARNTVFLAIALGWAEILNANDIFLGANEVDYSGFPDCRGAYFSAFEHMANLATKAAVEGNYLRIHTPLLSLSKLEIIQKGLKYHVDFSLTISCYDADEQGRACGRCESCQYRKHGFNTLGIVDPTPYRSDDIKNVHC